MAGETNDQRSRQTAFRRAMTGLLSLAVLTGVVFWVDLGGYYDWIKAVHVLAIISWMAGMLYLPRLFVNHVRAEAGSDMSDVFKGMERRLLRVIINPAMTVSWATGLWLAWRGFGFEPGWLHVKIAAVLVLSGVHGHFSKAVRLFAEDRNEKSEKYWRVVNEVPTILMIVIVLMVIVKPF